MNAPEQINLAMVAPFALGALTVEPATLRIIAGQVETLEPRVMQVLVALSQADGATVSRTELIERCWGGRAVGDDAINRVIGRLRKLAEANGGAGFRIETVPRVGYRLVDEQPVAIVPPAPPPRTPRRWWLWVALALVAALIVAFAIWRGQTPARQSVAVETFTVIGSGVPASFAPELRQEVIDFLANERFYAVRSDPPQTGDDSIWRVRVSIAAASNRQIVVFAQLLKPHDDSAVMVLRLQRDAQQTMLPRSLGLRIGRTAGCVLLSATDPELTGGYRPAALPVLAPLCVAWHDKTSTLGQRIDRLRAVLPVVPQSAYFRARLAELLGDQAASDPAGAAAARREGLMLVKAATALDPGQPHIPLALARLRDPRDLLGRSADYQRALAMRRSDCGCEFGDYSAFLSLVGRNAEARAMAERASQDQPKNIPWLRRVGEAAAATGDLPVARQRLDTVAGYFPDPGPLDLTRFNLAVLDRDWDGARALAAHDPEPAGAARKRALVDALASGDVARIRQSGAAQTAATAGPSRETVTALGMTGRNEEALTAASRLLTRAPGETGLLFEPPFAAVRRLPGFAALVERLGLTHYWRATGTSPDFCAEANAPALCATLRAKGQSVP